MSPIFSVISVAKIKFLGLLGMGRLNKGRERNLRK
jgi:hypothetical protein